METIKGFLDYFLHLDDKLDFLIGEYGVYIYAILFLIIFVETGFVVMPFLPGDSLLFAAGAFAAGGKLDISLLLLLFFIAAVAGDSLNYLLGKTIGLNVLKWKLFGRQLVKQKHLDKTHSFFEKYGPRAIIIARFVPIVRTFTPFVAGIGTMNYRRFFAYNLIGGLLWGVGVTLIGYFFGNIPIIKDNFEIVVFSIIGISLLPIAVELIKSRVQKNKSSKQA